MGTNKLLKLISVYLAAWRSDAKKAEALIAASIAAGDKVDKAVDKAIKARPDMFYLTGLPDFLADAAAIGLGVADTSFVPPEYRELLVKALEKPWTSNGVKLSARLYGAGRDMRAQILTVVGRSLKNGADWRAAAKALYDGYGKGAVIPDQAIAGYMANLRRWTPENYEEQSRLARIALRNINRLARKGAPNIALKSAYTKLLDAAKTGSEKAYRTALDIAINEKSRYVAERITRTESTRAWADGFFARALADPHVVAVRWKLSSRHPVYDICDMYAKADMYNLGGGVYPRDKVPPLPAHPHCLCYLSEVYRGEVDLSKQKDQTKKAVDSWLRDLPFDKQKLVLGLYGVNAWTAGDSWTKYLRGWQGLVNPTSRLDADLVRDLMERNLLPPTDSHLAAIAKSQGLSYTLGKRGAARWYSDDNKPIYPLYDGFYGSYGTETLKAGSVIVDRYGRDTGSFVSPQGTIFSERSLPPGSKNDEYHVYRVKKDITGVLSGRTAPWFGQTGGGWQYKLPNRIMELSDYLEEVDAR